nr:YHYH domain-containing protein [Paenibacillus periandrae]
MKATKILISTLILSLSLSSFAAAHPGRTDSNGGHTCKTNCEKWGLKYGEYHYHNGGSSNSSSSSNSGSSSSAPKPAPTPAPAATPPKEVIPKGTVKVNLPSYTILVNGQQVSNSTSKYPVFEYKDITYFPMTWNYTQALGLETKWDESVGFAIRKTSNKAAKLNADSGVPDSKLYAKLPDFNIFVNDVWIDNASEDYPLLVLNDVTYFPMTWEYAVEQLGLTISLDNNKFNISK